MKKSAKNDDTKTTTKMDNEKKCICDRCSNYPCWITCIGKLQGKITSCRGFCYNDIEEELKSWLEERGYFVPSKGASEILKYLSKKWYQDDIEL